MKSKLDLVWRELLELPGEIYDEADMEYVKQSMLEALNELEKIGSSESRHRCAGCGIGPEEDDTVLQRPPHGDYYCQECWSELGLLREYN